MGLMTGTLDGWGVLGESCGVAYWGRSAHDASCDIGVKGQPMLISSLFVRTGDDTVGRSI